jgi:hypothetical protein
VEVFDPASTRDGLLPFHSNLRVCLGEDRRENTTSNISVVACVTVAAGTYLANRYLTTTVSSVFQASCHIAPFLRLFNNLRGCNVGITDVRDLLRRWDGLRCHDIHTKFHTDWFSHTNVVKGGIHIQTDSRMIS